MVNVGNLDNIQKISIMSIQCSDSDMERVEDFLIFICAAVFGVAVGAVIELLVALTNSAFPAAPVPTDFPSGDRFGLFSRLNSHWCAAWEGRSFCPTKTFPFVNRRLSVFSETCCFERFRRGAKFLNSAHQSVGTSYVAMASAAVKGYECWRLWRRCRKRGRPQNGPCLGQCLCGLRHVSTLRWLCGSRLLCTKPAASSLLRCATSGVLSRHENEPRGELTATVELDQENDGLRWSCWIAFSN